MKSFKESHQEIFSLIFKFSDTLTYQKLFINILWFAASTSTLSLLAVTMSEGAIASDVVSLNALTAHPEQEPDPFLADPSVPIYTSADYLMGDRSANDINVRLNGNISQATYGLTDSLSDVLSSNTASSSTLIAQSASDSETSTSSDTSTSSSEEGIRLGGPRSVEGELEEESIQEDSIFGLFDNVLEPWYEFKNDVNDAIGLQFGLEYAVLLQNSSNTIGSDNGEFAASGIFQFQGTWNLLGRNTNYPGNLVFRFEDRHAYTDISPLDLGFVAGSIVPTGTLFNDAGFGFTNLHWRQDIGKRFAFAVGELDTTDFFNVYGLINPKTSFQNLSFSFDPTIAAPDGSGFGVIFGALPIDNFYFGGGIHDANGQFDTLDFSTFFDESEYFTIAELGYVSSPERRYFDRISATFWHRNEQEELQIQESWGAAFNASWFFNDRFAPFVRLGISEGDDGTSAALLDRNFATGFGYFTGSSSLLGAGFAIGTPSVDALDLQYTTELFYRFQLGRNFAITPDFQLIFNPALNPGKDKVFIAGLRTRITF